MRTRYTVFIFLLFAGSLRAQLPVTAPTVDSLTPQKLRLLLDELQNGPLVRHGTVAFSVRRVRDGQPLFDYNGQRSVAPASTLKLVTTATALAVLGEGYTYRTYLEYDGVLKDSVLTGNVYLRGTGDPSLGSHRFADFSDSPTLLRTWREALLVAGIRRIEGSIIGDATAIRALPVPDTWSWGDMGNYYGAGASGLNFGENMYRVVFQPSRTVGQPAKILRTEPATPYLRLLNRVRTGPAGSGDEVTMYNAPYSTQAYLEGTVPAGVSTFGVRGSLPDPAFAAAFALLEYLNKTGVTVSGGAQSYGPGSITSYESPAAPPKRTLLHLHTSAPLVELARYTNHQSLNLYAEALLLTAGQTLAKAPVTTQEALERLTQFWRNKNVDLNGFRPKDGSGLSPVNGLTTNSMTSLLAAMTKEKAFVMFYESIPVAGESGTVRSLARSTAAAGNLRAKSGTIEGVRAYAGYATAADGELLGFAITVNRYQPGTLNAVMSYVERALALLPEWNKTASPATPSTE